MTESILEQLIDEVLEDKKSQKNIPVDLMSDVVTHDCHKPHIQHLSPKLKEFGLKALRINHTGDDFFYFDFPELTPSNFRKRISRLTKKGLIEKTTSGNPASYRIIGEDTGSIRYDVTLSRMGLGQEYEKFLHDIALQKPAIHDVKLKFESNELHEYLKKEGHIVASSNKRITLATKIKITRSISVTISVYPHTCQIDLGCTTLPLLYDSRAALELMKHLTSIHMHIQAHTNNDVEIPEPEDWIMTNYHFNQDGKIEYTGEKFEIRIDEVLTGFIRFYSKQFSNNDTRLRLEQNRSPNHTVSQEIEQMNSKDPVRDVVSELHSHYEHMPSRNDLGTK